ncbi:hypothetical protein MRX96_058436 [Rhipicephalus microplus]
MAASLYSAQTFLSARNLRRRSLVLLAATADSAGGFARRTFATHATAPPLPPCNQRPPCVRVAICVRALVLGVLVSVPWTSASSVTSGPAPKGDCGT